MSRAPHRLNGVHGTEPLGSRKPSNSAITIELSPEQLDVLAELVAERLGSEAVADGWLRGAAAIADYIGSPPSRVFALSSAGRIPVGRDGSALIAKRGDLDAWLREGGGKRP